MSPSSSQHGNSGALVPGDGSTDVTSVLDHTSPLPSSLRRRIGAATAAVALLTTAGLVLDQSGNARAATAIGLGTADGYAVLAGSGITNTGSTVIAGDLGTFPTTTVTGENDITLTGTHRNDTENAAAKSGLLTAFNNAAGQASTQTISADLANPAATLTPGVYTQSTAMGLTGTLTLDGGGRTDAVFIFQAGDTLTTASASQVVLTGGTQACNVFWQVGVSATLGSDSTFVGTILAGTSITLNDRATVVGRVLASNGAVTMIDNVITRPLCSTPITSPVPTSPAPTSPAPTSPAPTSPTPTRPAPGVPEPGDDVPTGRAPRTTDGTPTSGRDGSPSDRAPQVPRVPVGSVDAGDGSSTRAHDSDA